MGDDAVDDNNECCGRTADLHAAATEQGDEESCDVQEKIPPYK